MLGAQKAAIAAVKPGQSLSKTVPNSLYHIAYDYIDSHGKDLHGDSLGKYFTHGLGHHVGLDVHDAYDPAATLEAGMVITIEPGIYIPEENLGVRIEDMVLVTEHGAKLLSAALPREPGEIEKLVGHGAPAAQRSLSMPAPSKHRFAYAGVLAGAFLVALVASWTPLGTQIDNSAYDWIFRIEQPQPWEPESIVLAIDELSFSALGGQFGLRRALADGSGTGSSRKAQGGRTGCDPGR